MNNRTSPVGELINEKNAIRAEIGRIKFFNADKGYGFIASQNGDCHFGRTALEEAEFRAGAPDGSPVTGIDLSSTKLDGAVVHFDRHVQVAATGQSTAVNLIVIIGGQAKKKAPTIELLEGHVKWFNGQKGEGVFVASDGTEAFLNVARYRGTAFAVGDLRPRRKVRYGVKSKPKRQGEFGVVEIDHIYPPERSLEPRTDGLTEGRVKCFNGQKGFGFINPGELPAEGETAKDIFVHVSTLDAVGLLPSQLPDGAKVAFATSVVERADGTQREQVEYLHLLDQPVSAGPEPAVSEEAVDAAEASPADQPKPRRKKPRVRQADVAAPPETGKETVPEVVKTDGNVVIHDFGDLAAAVARRAAS